MIANRIANAAVTIVFSFWPAFSRPCGARRPRSQARSSRSKRSISRSVAPERAPVAERDDEHERDRPRRAPCRRGSTSAAAAGRRSSARLGR